MYGVPYYNNTQANIDKIDSQIRELENLRNHLQKPQPSINQTFQLAPTPQSGIRFVENVDEVSKELVFVDTLFVNKNFTNMWFKNVKGEVKEYELKEIKKEDEKDLIIKELQEQIKSLKEGVKDEPNDTNIDQPTKEQ